MAETLLITFGCSWTFGVGAAWQRWHDLDQYNAVAWDQDLCFQQGWRGKLCARLGCQNVNFSKGGSSNQKQFRRATEFFSSPQWQRLRTQYHNIKVLWGITSTARNELYCLERGYLWNFFYHKPSDHSRFFLMHSYDHDHEVEILHRDMRHWNHFLQSQNVDVHWFDTFNTHDYANRVPGLCDESFPSQERYQAVAGPDWPDYQIMQQQISTVDPAIVSEFQEIFGLNLDVRTVSNLLDADRSPRDLMSMLCEKQGFTVNSDTYHVSDWKIDCSRVEFLLDQALINPFTHHPTSAAHDMIADYFASKIGASLD